MTPLPFNQDFSLAQRGEDLAVERFVPQLAVEALTAPVGAEGEVANQGIGLTCGNGVACGLPCTARSPESAPFESQFRTIFGALRRQIKNLSYL